jgi:polar amino acid transport system substrate-binding protein
MKNWFGNILFVSLIVHFASANAACSRIINVPVAPTGTSVIVKDNEVSGVFPEMLKGIGSKVGCQFNFPIVPRNRLSIMFMQTNEADLFLPSTQTKERDQMGLFMPFLKMRLALFTLQDKKIDKINVQQLLAKKDWMAITVRGYSIGEEYVNLFTQLEKEKRVTYADDVLMLTRMLKAGRADFAILLPSLFFSSFENDESDITLKNAFSFVYLEGMSSISSGVYISKKSLNQHDQHTLRTMFASVDKATLKHYYKTYSSPEIFDLYQFDN